MTRKFLALVIGLAFLSGCTAEHQDADHPELIAMVAADQQDRASDSDEPVAPRDEHRRHRVFELIARGEVVTPNDKLRAALILQHTNLELVAGRLRSESVENHYLAHKLALAAHEAGCEDARSSIAMFYDRYLWLSAGYQKYGTQSVWIGEESFWVTIDTTTTDAERARYGVRPLAELLAEQPMEPAAGSRP